MTGTWEKFMPAMHPRYVWMGEWVPDCCHVTLCLSPLHKPIWFPRPGRDYISPETSAFISYININSHKNIITKRGWIITCWVVFPIMHNFRLIMRTHQKNSNWETSYKISDQYCSKVSGAWNTRKDWGTPTHWKGLWRYWYL